MGAEEFFITLATGFGAGWASSWVFRAYIARKVRKAMGGQPIVPQPPQSEQRNVALLVSENERQQGQIGRLEERIQVLERIATDSPKRLADTIDNLR